MKQNKVDKKVLFIRNYDYKSGKITSRKKITFFGDLTKIFLKEKSFITITFIIRNRIRTN